MNYLLQMATAELERFLFESLPTLSDDWWKKHVVDRLSFQQQRLAQERNFRALRDLDFAALLRVLDQNWFELSSSRSLPKEGRNWVKELQTVRNKWAHLSSQGVHLSFFTETPLQLPSRWSPCDSISVSDSSYC